ncbi:MAG: electron transfer flavoprotein subunit beta/FixA family protein [Candidatus Krumholzibacteriia bacterium]|nr:electron transfer flavoprotein subunit beta/FixA family protein [bacterium]MCB9515259.1 electron transfer flavoprotein subunit beta/FixA family protein [Candidatus Latescibacterota bacterium]
MKIAVMVKQVADTAARIELADGGGAVKLDGVQMVLNPYDEFAVEQAIKVKEASGGEVVVFNLGPAGADEAVKTALAMGCDRAVLCRDDAVGELDAAGVAAALAAMIKKEGGFDLVFCGKQATDGDSHQVGPAVAQLLDLPAVTFVTSFALADGAATVGREAEGVRETLSVKLPALFTCQKGLNEPRYPSLPGIMQAARKPKETLTLADLGVDTSRRVQRKGLSLPPPRAAGKILKGEIPDQVKELVKLLRDEAKAV